MGPERWSDVERLFLELLDEAPAGRTELLLEKTGGDSELAAAVERLLAAHERSSGLTVGDGLEIVGADEEAVDGSRVGERVGAYELVERIGHGGMATVYRARRTGDSFDRDVAVKVLRAPVEDSELRARFRAEQQILAGLEHPSIARLYDGGVTDDRALYLVLELVEGKPIDAYCDEHGCDLRQRLRLFGKVCFAVAFAHQRLVVHRDLKPSNILVDEAGEVRLLDFGIAKLIHPDSPLATLTRSDFVPLTPGFASPEQLRGEQVTTASDVFSLGALLYLLTTGRAPFAESLADRLRALILDESIPKPSDAAGESEVHASLSGGLRGDLDAIVQKALRGQREDRYQSVQELVDDLERERRGEPVRARQGNWVYLSGRWMRRNRTQLVAGLSLLLVTALWAWSARRQAEEIGRQRDLAQLEAAKATETSEFLVGLFESADPTQTSDPDTTAREVLGRGAERLAEDLTTQPGVRVLMLESIASSYIQLGLPAEATPLLEEALAIRRRIGEEDTPMGHTLLTLSRARQMAGDLPGAAQAARESVEACRASVEPDPRCVGRGLQFLGMMLSYLGEGEEAAPALEEALDILRRAQGMDHEDTQMALHSLGVLAFQQSDWERAVRFFSQAHASATLWERTPLDAAVNANHLGTALFKLGRPAEALPLHERAYEVLAELFGPVNAEVGGSLRHMGRAQMALGDLAGAEHSIRQALEIQGQIFPPAHPWITFAKAGLAEVLAAQGRHEEAESLFTEANDGMRLTVPNLVQRTDPLVSFARFLMERGRLGEAMELLTEAEELAEALPRESESVRQITSAIEECRKALDFPS